MTKKEKSSPQKGEFIDLDKGQYKKNKNLKKYFLIFFAAAFIVLISVLYLNEFNLKELTIINKIEDEPEVLDELALKTKTDGEFSKINNEQFNLIKKKLDDLSIQIVDNQIKLSEAHERITNLSRQIQISNSRNQQNLDFFFAEKYIILNALLNLKNKFYRRQEFKEELNTLISRLNDESEIRDLISFFEDINIEKISKVDDLLERLNKKINYYEQDLDTFIDSRLKENMNDNLMILESKEDLIIYLKSLFDSTFKITRVNKNSNIQSQLSSEDLNFLKVLNKSKEYLIMNNIKQSVDVLEKSSFDDYEMNTWMDDASALLDSIEKLERLESILLEVIGKNVN